MGLIWICGAFPPFCVTQEAPRNGKITDDDATYGKLQVLINSRDKVGGSDGRDSAGESIPFGRRSSWKPMSMAHGSLVAHVGMDVKQPVRILCLHGCIFWPPTHTRMIPSHPHPAHSVQPPLDFPLYCSPNPTLVVDAHKTRTLDFVL